ncbi:hypothetical protein GQX73_g2753 [Xylaria multiplex]|uniref:BTB domain-containing protein n=1 Tax=Xylaria multiplex TaxID=323545 RepID=A0A7C8N872_9PEZI|nr:hypothetical protein GQX73_g2753 [Xylaria multiplex]
MDTQSYIIDPEGDVIITLRNFDALDRRIPIPELGPEPIKDKAGVPGKPPVEGGSAFDNILPTRVEPPAPEASVENSIGIKPTADSSVEPSKRTIQLQVSSAHLRLGSLYFKKVLDGRFKESQLAGDSLRHISAEDWDADAFLIVMRIMHGQNRFVPRTLDLETLANIAAIVDYYQCREMLEAFAEIWRLRMRKRSLPSTIGIDLIRFIFVSGVFRWPDEFNAVTKIAQDHSTGPLDTLGLPIPESIIGKYTIIT